MWILYCIIGILVAFYITIFIISIVKKRKSGIRQEKGNRFTVADNVVDENNKTNITFIKGDIFLKIDEIYYIGKKHNILPGKYTILSTVETITDIQIRLNGNVKNIKHNTSIVLANGDEITALQNNLLLR